MLGSGARASVALQNLINAGFNGTLYNGQGTSQWENAGYNLVDDNSVTPPCTSSEAGQCGLIPVSMAPSAIPNMAPTDDSDTTPMPSGAPTTTPITSAPTAKEVTVSFLEPNQLKAGIDAGQCESNVAVLFVLYCSSF